MLYVISGFSAIDNNLPSLPVSITPYGNKK